MKDPYDTLGVDPDATPDAIRRAYRSAARESHPDHGGDPAVMSELSAAYALLMDPERRKTYDRTGTAEKDPASILVAQVFTNILKSNLRLVGTRDLISSARDMISHQITGSEQTLHTNDQARAALLRALDLTRGPGDAVQQIIRAQIREVDAAVAQNRMNITLNKKALALLEGYSMDTPDRSDPISWTGTF